MQLKKLISNKRLLFWLLNLSGWAAFSLVWFLLYGPERNDFRSILKFFNSNFLALIFLTLCMRLLYKRMRLFSTNLMKSATLIIITSLAASFIWYYYDIFSMVLIYHDLFDSGSFDKILSIELITIIRRITSNAILLVSWSALYYFITIWSDWQKEKAEKERAMRHATEARLEMLKNQINPHFLFNSLNSISALIDENPEKAQLLINELSDFLRFSLVNKGHSRIPLQEEMRIVSHYFKIQQVRFEEKLTVEVKTDPDTLNILVPSCILCPLIENAVKHGMKTSGMPLEIELTSSIHNNALVLEIRNSGRWAETSGTESTSGTNTGLANVRERLKAEYNGKASLTISGENNFVNISIRIPVNKYR